MYVGDPKGLREPVELGLSRPRLASANCGKKVNEWIVSDLGEERTLYNALLAVSDLLCDSRIGEAC